jgi:hypothetical protein
MARRGAAHRSDAACVEACAIARSQGFGAAQFTAGRPDGLSAHGGGGSTGRPLVRLCTFNRVAVIAAVLHLLEHPLGHGLHVHLVRRDQLAQRGDRLGQAAQARPGLRARDHKGRKRMEMAPPGTIAAAEIPMAPRGAAHRSDAAGVEACAIARCQGFGAALRTKPGSPGKRG